MAGEWDWLKDLSFTIPPRANQGSAPQESRALGANTLDTSGTDGDTENPFLDWLEGEEWWRRSLYSNYIRGLGGSRAFQGYYGPRYMDVFNQYAAQPSTQALLAQGKLPTQTFSSFLKDFDIGGQFADLAPWERGERPGTFAPRQRWRVY